jgi:hypothetical protein
MRTSIKAAVVLTLVLSLAPGASYAATRQVNSNSGRGDDDSPIVRMIKNIKRLVVHILTEPTVPIPDTPQQ